uniref:MARVEL domain-containing protein n=1 Tax=Coturnix japonica TaxID=93934 RepID=A0A8C2Y5L6_COTJA
LKPSPSALCGPPLPSPPPSYLRGDFSPSARFFVTVAVLAFLYSAAAIVAYLGWMTPPNPHFPPYFPPQDLAVTALLAFLWLCSSSAWGKALTDIHSSVGSPLPHCSPPNVTCVPGDVTSMRSLSVSVVRPHSFGGLYGAAL